LRSRAETGNIASRGSAAAGSDPELSDVSISELGRERFAALSAYLDRCDRSGRWLVLTHDNPDPDALAAAFLLGKVLRRHFKRPTTLAYGGIIGRAENRQMVRALGMKLSRVRNLNWKHYRHFALVDAQPRTGNHQLPDEITPDVVIDHHPLRKATQSSPFVDLRTDYGATATIVAEYMLLSGLPISRRTATAVVYAMRTETLDFSRESPGPDRALHDYFFRLADKRLLGKIQRPRLPQSYFATLREALARLEGTGPLVISHLGPVAQPDIVPEIADLLLRMEGRTWSMVTGIHEDRLYCSLRTTNPRADAAGLMRRLLGRRGKGGGHGMLAGGWLPAEATAEAQRTQARNLGLRLAHLLRKNPERLGPIEL
jgi:nanoRNase/pAp phosphatase (c-di-AMP/oligoRNAs hydrolase)